MLFFAVAMLTAATAGRQPQIATDPHSQFLVLAYGNRNEVWVKTSDDGARSFHYPVKVATVDELMLGRHRGPRVALAGHAIIVTAISKTSGDLFAWRSKDRGKTWSPPVTINSVPKAAREGLHGLAANEQGEAFVTWLDLRDNKTKIYGATSADRGAHWSKDFLIYSSPDGHTCECCHPSALVAGDGTLYAMFRNWLGGSRDMWVARSSDGGKTFTPEKLGEGTWPLNGCPMDGGDLQLNDGNLRTIWRRGDHVFLDTAGEPERDLGPGKDPTLGPYGLAAWTSDGQVFVKKSENSQPVSIGKGGYPAAAKQAVAWEDDGNVYVYVAD